MTKANLIFRCNSYKSSKDGGVNKYMLEIINNKTKAVEEILVTPKELASPVSMKKLLMNKKLFYSPSRKEHAEMLKELFSSVPELL